MGYFPRLQRDAPRYGAIRIATAKIREFSVNGFCKIGQLIPRADHKKIITSRIYDTAPVKGGCRQQVRNVRGKEMAQPSGKRHHA